MKVIFDGTLVVLAILLSLLFCRQLERVQEGTTAAAIFVGLVTKMLRRPFACFERKYLP